jgi:Rrf2 family protein
MKISTSARYGIRVMLDVTCHGTQNAVGRQMIADRQQVTSEYIAQIARRLTQAGLLETIRGPGGGYKLGRASDQIRLGDIYRAIEGPAELVPCVSDVNSCCRSGNCATRVVWLTLSRLINDYLDSISLFDLTSIAKQLDDACAADCQSVVDFVQSGLATFGTNGEDCSMMER